MARKNFILMFGVVSLSLVAFGLLVHSLNTQAIGEERANLQGPPFTEGQMVGQNPVLNNIPPENQPPEARWIPLASDPADQGSNQDCDIKAVYYQVYSGILYFKVEHYGNWEYGEPSDEIHLDVDLNASTGRPTWGIGVDFILFTKGWGGSGAYACWDLGGGYVDCEDLDYNDTPVVGNTYVLGMNLCFFCHDSIQQVGTFDVIVCNWLVSDKVPNSGHLTMDLCFCSDPNADGVADIVDVVYLINYVLKSGQAPQCR